MHQQLAGTCALPPGNEVTSQRLKRRRGIGQRGAVVGKRQRHEAAAPKAGHLHGRHTGDDRIIPIGLG